MPASSHGESHLARSSLFCRRDGFRRTSKVRTGSDVWLLGLLGGPHAQQDFLAPAEVCRANHTQSGERHSNAHEHIECCEEPRPFGRRRQITVAHCSYRTDREVEGVGPAPSFQVVVDHSSDGYHSDQCRQRDEQLNPEVRPIEQLRLREKRIYARELKESHSSGDRPAHLIPIGVIDHRGRRLSAVAFPLCACRKAACGCGGIRTFDQTGDHEE